MNFTLHQLQIFLKITQTKSITKAAEQLHLTQPAVSIQLKNFQDQFDIPLTEVFGRKLYITDFGKEMAIATERILNEVVSIQYKSQAFKGQLTGRLKISVVSTGKYIVPYFLHDFLRMHPEVELILDVTNREKVVESLENNEVDFCLVSVLPDKIQFEKIELMENRLFLVGKPPESNIEGPKGEEILDTRPLIYRESGSGTRYTMEKYFQKNKKPIKRQLVLSTNEAVKHAVMAGLGYSILPLIGIKNELQTGELEIIPVQGFPLKSSWNIIWLKNKDFSPVADSYLKFLFLEKDRIILEKFSWIESYGS
jgi:DNA-binding transcriptional LysR family regulator